MDVSKIGKLDTEDFRWGLHAARIFLSEEEMDVLFKEYEVKGEGLVDYMKFLEDIKVHNK